MKQKWICNKCGYETLDKPEKNQTCPNCHKGRFKVWNQCECGKWFHPERTSQKYCSEECGYKYRKTGGKKGKHYPNTQRARIAVCPVCGKEFRAVHDYKGRYSVYCSKECWSKRSVRESKTCPICGKKFYSYDKNATYCSKKCYSIYQKSLTGENSIAWKGGKTAESKCRRTHVDYKEWRNKVFERDNYTCQMCGKTNCYLEAHHIKEVCNYPELIYDVNNGLTLCSECHKKTDNYGYKAKSNRR